MKVFCATLIASLVLLFAAANTIADPGEVDEKGGHYNRQTGEYHYHNAPPNPNQQTPKTLVMIKAEALTTAERDAKAHTVWYHYGFFFGPIAIGAAYVLPAAPRVETYWVNHQNI